MLYSDFPLVRTSASEAANGFTAGEPLQPWRAVHRNVDFRGAQFDIICWALPAFGYQTLRRRNALRLGAEGVN